MRSDYLPATAVCFVCRHLIHEELINAEINGTITYRDEKKIVVDPFTGHLCKECRLTVSGTIQGGIPAAKKREERWKDEESAMGE